MHDFSLYLQTLVILMLPIYQHSNRQIMHQNLAVICVTANFFYNIAPRCLASKRTVFVSEFPVLGVQVWAQDGQVSREIGRRLLVWGRDLPDVVAVHGAADLRDQPIDTKLF